MLLAGIASAATPVLSVITPRGVQLGTEADVEIHGQRLADIKEILFYRPGITVTKFNVTNPQTVKAHIQVAKDAPIGEYPCRIRTATGLSEVRTFHVTAYPVVEEKEPNNDFEHAQPIPLNTTVTGVIQNEDLDYFAIELKKGQRITAEVQGMRLGDAMFDPFVGIYDDKKFALAESDDTALGMQDPIASAIAPADGKYYVLVRDSIYSGGANFYYLLNIGTFPRPTSVFPLGGKTGEELAVKFIGDINGDFSKTIKLPDEPVDSMPVFADQDGLVAPTPNFLRVSPFPNVMEAEGDNDFAHATPVNQEIPFALNGIISKPGEQDFFRFHAKKGQVVDVRVHARTLRSPLDSVIVIYNAKGGQIAVNDDSGGPDSYLRFNPPEDGEYVIRIFDQLSHGGPDYTYRVEITPVKPSIRLQIPQYQQNSQERQWVVIPRGNRFAQLMRVTRSEFGGDVKLSCADLPEGVSMKCDTALSNLSEIPVVFEARPDAPVAGKLCDLKAESADPKNPATGGYLQPVELVYGQNNATMYSVELPKLSVAVADEAPFKLRIVPLKVPIVQNGEMTLKVVAERSSGFKGPISVRMVFNPPGIGSAAAVDMPADKDEVEYPISASGGAPPHTWKICVVGEADVNGPMWVGSDLTDLQVAEPFMDLKIDMSAAEQGKPCSVLAHIDNRTKFEGKAQVKLIGLPPNATATDMQISASDNQVVFPVTTAPNTPVGSHGSLFCQVTVTKDGEPIVHNLGRGGVLRVDKPAEPKKGEAPKPAIAKAPAAGTPAAKPLSRLEKLRLDAEQKK
ncbi:MAG TPA: pre-peptidase C-terminal domain-containing protein [Tepidisphaeraceae bacterium]